MRECPARPALLAVALILALVSPPDTRAAEDSAPSAAAENKAPESDVLDESMSVRREANQEGAASQKRVEEISDETERLFARYSNTLRQLDSTKVYNKQMEELVASQNEELASLSDQLDRVEEVGRSVTPLMLRMIEALAYFVELDVPFLLDERRERVESLRSMMNRADVATPEKYRRIMEAYQIENEYGRTIEAYRSTIEQAGKELTVDFLRFGRVALVYQTLDESQGGMWNQTKREWEPLESSYKSAIREGIRIARKQAAPSLIRLPFPVAQRADEAS